MTDKVVFNLKRCWLMDNGKLVDLYEEIKLGRKTIEYRDCTPFWQNRLLNIKDKITRTMMLRYAPADFTQYLKHHKAWFVVGYPKGNLPRLEADITKLILNDAKQFEVSISNVKEVTTFDFMYGRLTKIVLKELTSYGKSGEAQSLNTEEYRRKES